MVYLQLTFLAFLALSLVTCQECPSGYAEYSDEKCFILMKSLRNKDEAEQVCKSDINNPGGLALVKSQKEQDFVNHYVFNISASVNSVWIGAERNAFDGIFYWDDRSRVIYANWEVGSPTNETGRNCIAVENGLSKSGADGDKGAALAQGEWRDVSCQGGNWFVCETLQNWSAEKIQRAVMDLRLWVEFE